MNVQYSTLNSFRPKSRGSLYRLPEAILMYVGLFVS